MTGTAKEALEILKKLPENTVVELKVLPNGVDKFGNWNGSEPEYVGPYGAGVSQQDR